MQYSFEVGNFCIYTLIYIKKIEIIDYESEIKIKKFKKTDMIIK